MQTLFEIFDTSKDRVEVALHFDEDSRVMSELFDRLQVALAREFIQSVQLRVRLLESLQHVVLQF